MNQPIDEADVRQLAAERLSYVALLQAQYQRRRRHDVPWRDPRQGQGRVLALLKLKPEITQRELTFLLGLTRQSSAELLNKLEQQGLIVRQSSADDRRVVTVRLTEAGQAADQQLDRPTVSDDLLDCLDNAEVTQLADYLARIIDRLEAGLGDDFDRRRQALWQAVGERDEAFDPRPHRRGGPRGRDRFPGGWFAGMPLPPHPGPPLPPGAPFPPGPPMPPPPFPPRPPMPPRGEFWPLEEEADDFFPEGPTD